MLSILLNTGVKPFTKPTLPIGQLWFTCSSSLQSELWRTYTYTPTGLSRFKNVIFRRHDVIQENITLIDTDQFNLCRDLHFTHQNLMVMSSGDSRMKKVGGPLRGQGKVGGVLRSIIYSSAQTTAFKMLIKRIPWNAGSGASSPCSFARNAMFSSLFAV